MATPDPQTRTFTDVRPATGVVLRVDFTSGRILGPVDDDHVADQRVRDVSADPARRRPE